MFMICLFFDTETTGLKSKEHPEFKPALVQIGAILQDSDTMDVLGEVNLICTQTHGPIPVEASNVHGITDDIATKYGVDIRLIDMIFASLVNKADVIVAHNIDYDLDVVEDNMPHSWKRIKDKIHFCTKEENIEIVKAEFPPNSNSKRYYSSKGYKPTKRYKWPTLMETYVYYFGEEFHGAHDAMADIRACRDVFFAMEDVETIIEDKAAKLAEKKATAPLEQPALAL